MSNEVNKINWELVREMSAQYGHIVPNMRFGEFNVVPNGSNFAPGAPPLCGRAVRRAHPTSMSTFATPTASTVWT